MLSGPPVNLSLRPLVLSVVSLPFIAIVDSSKLIFKSGVNIINILSTAFSSESLFGSFSLVTCYWKKAAQSTFVQKM